MKSLVPTDPSTTTCSNVFPSGIVSMCWIKLARDAADLLLSRLDVFRYFDRYSIVRGTHI